MSTLYFVHHCEEMEVTKTSRGTCLPPGLSSCSARAVTSWAEFNQEGHHVCLAHKTTDSLTFSQSHSPLPSPDFHGGSAECQVQLQYQLSGIGVRSKWDSEKTEIHTQTPNHTKKLRSEPPLSPGSCNGSSRLPLCITAIWANLMEQQQGDSMQPEMRPSIAWTKGRQSQTLAKVGIFFCQRAVQLTYMTVRCLRNFCLHNWLIKIHIPLFAKLINRSTSHTSTQFMQSLCVSVWCYPVCCTTTNPPPPPTRPLRKQEKIELGQIRCPIYLKSSAMQI